MPPQFRSAEHMRLLIDSSIQFLGLLSRCFPGHDIVNLHDLISIAVTSKFRTLPFGLGVQTTEPRAPTQYNPPGGGHLDRRLALGLRQGARDDFDREAERVRDVITVPARDKNSDNVPKGYPGVAFRRTVKV
jgi:hypothetical protein